MTPSEKAAHLAGCFYQLFKVDLENSISVREANACAIIVCDKIIKQLEELCKPEYTSFWHGEKAGETVDGYELKDFWEQVKQILSKESS